MTPASCTDSANGLLLFYLNGTLSNQEEIEVRRHVDECDICSREMEVLSGVAQGVRQRALHEVIPPDRKDAAWSGRHALLAAAILLPILTGVLLFRDRLTRTSRVTGSDAAQQQDMSAPPRTGGPADAASIGTRPGGEAPEPGPADRQPAGGEGRTLNVAALLDLRGGPVRSGADVPLLVLDPRVEAVSIRFTAPVAAEARRALEIRDPEGSLLLRQEVSLVLDPLGAAICTVPASLLAAEGRYVLVLNEVEGGSEERAFRYPFQVQRQSPAATKAPQ
jgi:hypothetical protein